MAKKKERDTKNLQILAVLLVILIIAVFALIKYFDTTRGRIFLLDMGVRSRFAEVQKELGQGIIEAFEKSGIDRDDAPGDGW